MAAFSQEAEARGEVEQTATKLRVDNTKLVKENDK